MQQGHRPGPPGQRLGSFYNDLEKLLLQQLEANPRSQDLQLKLLELYFETGKVSDFIRTARNMRSAMPHANSREWAKVASMGRMIAPEIPLFTEAQSDRVEFVGMPTPAASSPATPAYRRFGDEEHQMPLFGALAQGYERVRADPRFIGDLDLELVHIANRPSSLLHARRYSQHLGGAQIFFKREDLSPPGSHLIINIVGQALLAKRLERKTLVTATINGQKGVVAASVASRMGLRCVVYMDRDGIERHQANVFRMKVMGAVVQAVDIKRLPAHDIRQAALEYWVGHPQDTMLAMGLDAAPQPFPTMGRDFSAAIGRECRRQSLLQAKRPADVLVCRGGNNADAIGFLEPFLADRTVRLVCVEASKTLGGPAMTPGRMLEQQFDPRVQELSDKQKRVASAILEGLEYPSVTREHAWLKSSGRVEYVQVSPVAAKRALVELAQLEGIVAAIETAHVVAWVKEAARRMSPEQAIVVMLSETSDKDIWEISKSLNEIT